MRARRFIIFTRLNCLVHVHVYPLANSNAGREKNVMVGGIEIQYNSLANTKHGAASSSLSLTFVSQKSERAGRG